MNERIASSIGDVGAEEVESDATQRITKLSGKSDALEFLAQMLVELRTIAASQGELILVYILEMAALEASTAMDVERFRADLHTDS